MFNLLMAFFRFLLTDRQSSLSHTLQRVEVVQINAIQLANGRMDVTWHRPTVVDAFYRIDRAGSPKTESRPVRQALARVKKAVGTNQTPCRASLSGKSTCH